MAQRPGPGGPDDPTPARTRVVDVLPLTPLQAGMFFHATAGGADVYRAQLVLDLHGPLDAPLLHRCAQRLLDRHTALRTVFVAEETDEPVGVVLEGVRLPWRASDLRDLDQPGRESERAALIVAERTRPLPLDRAPLLRMLLVRLADRHHQLVLTNHHIVLDGWSMPVLVRELGTLYAAGGDPDALPPAVGFAEHLAWLAAQDGDAPRRWRAALHGLPGPTLLAGPGPGGRADQPVRLPLPVTAELSGRLTEQARRLGVTLNTLLQTLWGVTLGVETGQTDVVFGTTVSGRPAGTADRVGLYINTIPVRVTAVPGESAGALARRVQDEQAALLDAQHVPLAELQARTGFAPLLDTLLVFESYPSAGAGDALAGTGLAVSVAGGHDATHFPLVLVAAPGLSLVLKYQPGALDPARAERIGRRLLRLAEQVAAGADRPLAGLDASTDDERRTVVDEQPVRDGDLAGLVEHAVERTPDAVALRAGGDRWTYRELWDRAGELAGRLRALPGDPLDGREAVVGLHLPRSAELVVGMLGVLRAGAAFVALDPGWPDRRIAAVAAGARIAAVCVTPGAESPAAAPAVPVHLDARDDRPAPPRAPVPGDQLAYVIYTSGSTGTPKGAMIRQRSIVNRLGWQRGLLGFGPGDAALFKAPLGFDISINEIFLPLVSGATLVVAGPGVERDVEALGALIAGERVTFCYLVASTLAALLELPGFTAPALRHVWCGGELLTPRLYQRFRERLGATMYHGYGPAEATIGVTHEVHRPDRPEDGGGADRALGGPAGGTGGGAEPGVDGGATIGRPNPNTRVEVLDRMLRPAPAGVVGELYVSGVLLGRGYLGDPGRTAERFVAAPGGRRRYRTGDLGAALPDGRLRFAGRGDHQVKVRGMRVEPGEVEAAIAAHPAVAAAAVLTPADATGAVRLVGCYVERDGARVRPDQLRGWLRDRLAEHLVPAELHARPALPTHDSGKVDRDALAAALPAPSTGGRPARTPTEHRVLTLFRDVLGRPDAGVDDDFFALGGHSLLATRLVVRARAELDPTLTVRRLFDAPTAAALARRLDAAAPDGGEPETRPDGAGAAAGARWRAAGGSGPDGVLLPLRRTGDGPPLFCVHPVSGLAQAYAGLLGPLPGRPLYGLQARSLTADADRPADLDAMAADYLSAVRSVQPEGPYHLLGWSLGGTVAHLIAGRLAEQGQTVTTLAVLDALPASDLPAPDDRPWTLGRGLAALLRAHGYPVVPATPPDPGTTTVEPGRTTVGPGATPDAPGAGSSIEPGAAAALTGADRDGPLAGFTADELCAVALSWRHSAGLRVTGPVPVHRGELLLVEAARERRPAGALAARWAPHVTGPVRTHRVDTDHWGLAAPSVLTDLAARISPAHHP